MNLESQEKAIELLYKAIPYPTQVKDLDLSDKGYVFFTWRSQRLRLCVRTSDVMECDGGALSGSDVCILLRRLIEIEFITMRTK